MASPVLRQGPGLAISKCAFGLRGEGLPGPQRWSPCLHSAHCSSAALHFDPYQA